MVHFGLRHDLDRIPVSVVARIHLPDELWHLRGLHARGLDPSHFAPANAKATFRHVNCHDGVFRKILGLAV